jgi:uncharacterized RDD family membrane protein YckC
MDIWLITDGEKTGPFSDFEIGRKIENLEIPPTTPAWHEGLPGWVPLHTLKIFSYAFERAEELPAAPSATVEAPPSASPSPEPKLPEVPSAAMPSAYPIRRFWARWFDLYLYAGIWWILMWAAGRDIGATLVNPWVMLLHFIPWFVLEAVLLHRYGTTPGKWLLGINVVNNDGSLLTLPESTRRSARVLFIGIGFGWDIVALICQVMSYFTTRRLGRPLWDHAGGHRVVVQPLHPLRLVAYVFVMFISLQLKVIVVAPYFIETASRMYPSLKEQFEKNPPWHLPKRH